MDFRQVKRGFQLVENMKNQSIFGQGFHPDRQNVKKYYSTICIVSQCNPIIDQISIQFDFVDLTY